MYSLACFENPESGCFSDWITHRRLLRHTNRKCRIMNSGYFIGEIQQCAQKGRLSSFQGLNKNRNSVLKAFLSNERMSSEFRQLGMERASFITQTGVFYWKIHHS